MSVVNVENIDLAASLVNVQHSRCCCKPSYMQSSCEFCKPTTQICCLMATVGTNVRKHYLARYSGPDATPWEAGDPCDSLGSHNLCGSLRTIINAGTECMSSLHLSWTVLTGCETVRVTLSNGDSGLGPSVSQDLSRTWFSSPQTFTHPDGVSDDVVIENCPVPTTVLPVVAETGINLVGELWSLGANPGDPDIKTDQRTRGTGNDICGSPEVCGTEGGDINWRCSTLRWSMLDDLETIRFVIEHPGSCGGTTATGDVPWGTGVNGTGTGDWFDNTPIIIPVTGGYWKLGRVVGCGTLLDCEPYGCYPLCVANTCPDDPETVNASILFWDLECSGGTGDHDGQFTYNPSGGGSFEDMYSAGDWPFTGTPTIQCDGTDIVLDDLDLFGVTWGPIVMTLECVDGEASWSHVFTDPSGGGSGGGPSETCTLTIFTNNGGGL